MLVPQCSINLEGLFKNCIKDGRYRFYSPTHKLLRSIKTYTERQLDEVMINVESTCAGVG